MRNLSNRMHGYARFLGFGIVVYLMVMNAVLIYLMAKQNVCNPAPILDQVLQNCQPRYDATAIGSLVGALSIAMGGLAGYVYRENKRAEIANGKTH